MSAPITQADRDAALRLLDIQGIRYYRDRTFRCWDDSTAAFAAHRIPASHRSHPATFIRHRAGRADQEAGKGMPLPGKTSAREGRVMRCADCRFFHHDGREYGECRRMPPQGEFSANFTEDGYERRRFKVEVYRFANAVFPNLSRDMWCGEHQTKETNDDT